MRGCSARCVSAPTISESLQQQTATADVLKVISRSLVDLETVLETLVETVARLCRADQVYMFHLRHDLWHLVAAWGLSAEAREFFLTHPFTPGRGSTSGRAALERRAVLIPDVLQDPEYALSEGQKIAGYRTTLGIPLLREDTLIGVFSIARTRVEAFTEKEIELATTFADQAVIAIENARLFEELRDRQAELRVTFDNMGDGVVMFDAEARLAAWNRNFQEMLDLPDAFLAGRPSYAGYFRYLADRGEYSADLEAQLSRTIEDTRREMRFERTRPDGRVIEVRRNSVPGGGFVLIYADVTERKRAEEAIRAARDAAETALRELQMAQASLVHAQKMAALGQLTAGIAHEIKNPLNFVNNFSSLSVELLDELREALLRPANRREGPRRDRRADRYAAGQPRQDRAARQAGRLHRQEHAAAFARGLRRAPAGRYQCRGRGEPQSCLPRRAGRKAGLQHHPGAVIRSGRWRGRRVPPGDHPGAAQSDLERLLCCDQAQGRSW